MRRRLTVTGASSTIDGTAKTGVDTSGDVKKYKGSKDQVRFLELSEPSCCFLSLRSEGNPQWTEPISSFLHCSAQRSRVW